MGRAFSALARSSGVALLSVALLCATLSGLGCRAHVEDLSPRTNSGPFRPLAPWQLVAGVTGADAGSGGLAEGLADFLVNEQVFRRVVYPFDEGRDKVDVIVQVRASGDFRSGGAKNFFTWFPGGLLLIPNFRGTRWTYDAHAEVNVVDATSGQPVASYTADTTHMSVHQSASPGPFLSAALIIPAVIKGFRVTSPKRPYTDMIYAETYPALWRKITSQMVAQQADYVALGEQAKSRRAGSRKPRPTLTEPKPYGSSALYGAAPPPAPGRRPPPAPVDYGELYSKQVAVVIGIDKYKNWPGLTGASNDARRMATYLRQRGFDTVIEIYDRDATRQRLLQVLGNDLGEHVDKDSMAFIYFAGHGETETLPGGAKRGYLIPADADDDVFATGISMDTVRDLSNRMTAKHVLYAIDACYSGLALTRGIAVPRKTSGYLKKVTKMRAVQILAAGAEGEQAVEVGGQGVFTTYLLRALQGEADLDGDGAVTAREIGAYVRPQVTVASGARQTPQFGTIEGSGEVVFLPR